MRSHDHRAYGLSLIGVLSFFLLAGSLNLPAQSTGGSIIGVVKDQTGAVIPDVDIRIINVDTGAKRTVQSSPDGAYLITELPPGSYTIEARAEGFNTEILKGITVTVGSQARMDISLTVGALTTEVVVEVSVPILQHDTAEVAVLMDEDMIADMPLNARDIHQLAYIQPGVQFNHYHNFGKQMVVSGSRPEHNRYLQDGTDTTWTFKTAPVSAAGIIMGVEAVKEFKVLTGNYDAAYGEKDGGVINTVTKSGTNSFHGSVYEFLRNDKLDTRNFFDQEDNPPPFKRNQFGAAVGGPIVREKTFFFTNYEGFRQRLGLSNLGIMMDDRARLGFLPDGAGGERFVGVSPGTQLYLPLFPQCNGANLGGGACEFFSNPSQKIDENYWIVKIDHTLSSKNTLAGTFTLDRSEEFSPTQNPNFADGRTYDKHILSLQDTHVFSPSWVSTLRVGANRTWYFFRTDTLVDVDPALYAVPDPFYAPTDIGQFPRVSITGFKGLAETRTGVTITPRWFGYTMFQISENLNHIRGKHSIKFGGQFKRWHDNSTVANPNSRGAYTCTNLEQFLTGICNTFSIYDPANRSLERSWRQYMIGFYVTDTYQVLPNLTFDLGIRWEYVPGPSEVHGRVSNVRNPLTDAVAQVGEPYFKAPKKNFAPRIGFNWDPFGTGKTSLRGGAGIFHDEIIAWYWFLSAPGSPPFTRAVTISNAPLPIDLSLIPPTAPVNHTALMEFEPSTPTKYSYNLTFQREIVPGTSFMIAYVGSQGRHIGRGRAEHQFFPTGTTPAGGPFWDPALQPLSSPNPNFRALQGRWFDANSFYNSLQLTLERRSSAGLGFRINYSWAKSVDDASNEYGGGSLNGGSRIQYARDRKSSRGPSSFNSEHTMNFTASYDLPLARNATGAAEKVLAGWQISTLSTLQSGVPFDLRLGFDNSGSWPYGSGTDRPDWAPGCTRASATLGGPNQYFDVNCFLVPPAGWLGNTGSRILTGPGLITTDFSLKKFTAFGPEGMGLEFRFEVFNFLNRANFSVPSNRNLFRTGGARRGGVGRITATVTPSRQMQFGLKFTF